MIKKLEKKRIKQQKISNFALNENIKDSHKVTISIGFYTKTCKFRANKKGDTNL
nr:MAG TPA: hypothetical protein [Bacteriophage sp.]